MPLTDADLARELERADCRIKQLEAQAGRLRELLKKSSLRSFDRAQRAIDAEADLRELRSPLEDEPQRTRCQRCGRADGLDAVVSDEDWERISGGQFAILCLWCMDQLATEQGIGKLPDVGVSAVLHFAGRAIYAESHTIWDDELDSQRQLRELREAVGPFVEHWLAMCSRHPPWEAQPDEAGVFGTLYADNRRQQVTVGDLRRLAACLPRREQPVSVEERWERVRWLILLHTMPGARADQEAAARDLALTSFDDLLAIWARYYNRPDSDPLDPVAESVVLRAQIAALPTGEGSG